MPNENELVKSPVQGRNAEIDSKMSPRLKNRAKEIFNGDEVEEAKFKSSMQQRIDDQMSEEQYKWYNKMLTGTGRKGSKKSSNYASSLARSFSPAKARLQIAIQDQKAELKLKPTEIASNYNN